jgi:hypothetical protein
MRMEKDILRQVVAFNDMFSTRTNKMQFVRATHGGVKNHYKHINEVCVVLRGKHV